MEYVVVRLLEHDLSKSDKAKHVDFKVLNVIKHEEYNGETKNNDIALLRLDTGGVDLGPDSEMNPVCLPPKGIVCPDHGAARKRYVGYTLLSVRRKQFFRSHGRRHRLGSAGVRGTPVGRFATGEIADHEKRRLRKNGKRAVGERQHVLRRISGGRKGRMPGN